MSNIIQKPIAPSIDLRDMLRQHIIARALAYMRAAEERRTQALSNGDITGYQQAIRSAVRGFYGELPFGSHSTRPGTALASAFDKNGYRLENVLFDSFPGWQVNATVYVPLDYRPPFPAIVIPVGHSGKQFDNYQLPAQFFARSGFLAVLFDPPGQASEKQPGNDHFWDGVRCYLVGQTSSRYFVADALRCIDYLETRSDVDLSHGVAMTGVSGGGTTTTLAVQLDDRIAVIGPSCCLSPLSDLDITQCYANCPETHMYRRYAEGIDEVDLLCAAAPKPTLLMAGELDEVFHVEDTAKLSEQVRAFFDCAGSPEQFEFFIDRGRGHCYSLDQARRFVAFANRWLLNKPASEWAAPALPDDALTMAPYEELKCYPRLDIHMRSLTLGRARQLEVARSAAREVAPEAEANRICTAALNLTNLGKPVTAPEAQVSAPLQVWTHDWRQALLKPEPGIELPATILQHRGQALATLLHFDDQHRNRLLYRNGLLAQVAGFTQDGTGYHYLGVDLRGWGDTYPAMYPFEMAGWATIERTLGYKSNALGDPLMTMRTRDGLAALAFLRSREDIGVGPLVLTGAGLGGLVALHVAALSGIVINGKVNGVVIWDGLASWMALLETERYTWPADTFIPNVLLHYDLPELVQTLPCPVVVYDPRDGEGKVLPEITIRKLNQQAGREIYRVGADAQALSETLRQMSQAK